ncbi:MAG: ribosomal RNA small subunit methyltransferase A [Candidatus Vogelbacteria bacterium RIFOXYD1_FULL_44_32]|uniref:Ribosomal RNA small subunit methyltransferase A n=1 Tax=Candidatus Vogelbacteria bacterium RIFOXYD1_FULL_44_32 TaxID=1802438 RepID=A0A1G2QE62_9BACT|nr:MAG: ribosomal RNA small subunit methyltransferase A [Candidatus Vogelbacteria bacterium RIFOXYD1_FULL_44_32]
MEFIHAKKSLGQNWLVSQSALAKIVDAAGIQRGERVLEIGPGKGVLTEKLLAVGAEVTAIEKDRRLTLPLQEKFAPEIKNEQLVLLEADALKLPESLLADLTPYKLVANIPYYITGEIIRNFLESDFQPLKAVIMVQKEVAQRIVASDNKQSILSISVKAYGEPSIAGIVPRGAFRPVPNVDSAILVISNINKNFFGQIDEKKFFSIIKKGFAQKRKLLKSNLKITTDALKSCGLDEKVRAEDLTLAEWRCLAEKIEYRT